MTSTSRVKEAPASLEVQPKEIGDPRISVPRSQRIAQHEPGSRAWLDIPTRAWLGHASLARLHTSLARLYLPLACPQMHPL